MRAQVADPLSPFLNVEFRPRKGKSWISLQHLVKSATFTHTGTRKSSKIDITLENEDQSLFSNEDVMRKGTPIRFTWGYPGLVINAGNFVIKSHKPNRTTLRLVCLEGKRSSMTRKPTTFTYDNVRRSDVVRIIANRHGFNGFIGEDTQEIYPTVTQAKKTDWEFLAFLADRENRELFVSSAGLHWEVPKRKQRPKKFLKYVKHAKNSGQIINWNLDSVETGLPGRIVVRGFDPLKGQEYEARASESDTDIVRLSDSEDFMDPEEGDRLARGTIGREVEINIGARSREEAKRTVDSLYQQLRYGAAKMTVDCIGDPLLRARTVIIISGIGPAIDGAFWVKEVIHRIGPGYICSLKLNREGLNKLGGRGRRAFKTPSFDSTPVKAENFDVVFDAGEFYK